MKRWQWAMQSPRLYRLGGKMASLSTNGLTGRSGTITALPPPFNAWTNSRDFPPFAKESFRERLKRQKANGSE